MVTHGAFGPAGSTPVAVLEAVADAIDVDVMDLETPLAEVIDPDCLESLWSPLDGTKRNVNGVISFEYAGCRVTVKSDGTVEARRL